MFQIFLTPMTTTFMTFSAMFGVVLHDAQLTKLAEVAISKHANIESIQPDEVRLLAKASVHTHVAAANYSSTNTSTQTSIQPRNENDKKYVSNRRHVSNDSDSDYVWPSI